MHSFKVPSTLERKHDYLWRHYIDLPERGKFSVFNRTHYENVLVTKVHPEYILGENLPNVESVDDIDDGFWERRYQQINDFERHIADNGTIIFKFFLHLSKEEQRHRLLRRIRLKQKTGNFRQVTWKKESCGSVRSLLRRGLEQNFKRACPLVCNTCRQ